MEIVSELALLKEILRPPQAGGRAVLANGDDAAVVRIGRELVAITTDALIEGHDFSFEYYSAPQAGAKAIEAAVSDLIAVGARPCGVVVALTLPSSTGVEQVQALYEGVYSACSRLECELLGGDLSNAGHAIELIVTAIGRVPDEASIRKRSGAHPGDLVFVTGELGGSAAGLRAIQAKLPGFEAAKKRHLQPRCRFDLLEALPAAVHAVIDVSDGLASEIHHICRASGCGAVLEASRIPTGVESNAVAAALGEDVLQYALHGGEDYELLYTIPESDRAAAIGTEIGCITRECGVFLERGGTRAPLVHGGYDHFAK